MTNFTPGANLWWPAEGISRLDAGRSVERLTRKRTMKLKLKGTSPIQRRLALRATVKVTHYLVFVGQPSGRKVEAREIAVRILEQFMASDRDFRQWQKMVRKSAFESHESRTEKSPQMNGEPSKEL